MSHTETSGVACLCSGSPMSPNSTPCNASATQEDFLCDHCRAMDCPTVTSPEVETERWRATYTGAALDVPF